ncbi:MAG TPA: hypothetical protein VGL82_22040 [Bryobacteraceae bacterium]|jgi:hypothetical protein
MTRLIGIIALLVTIPLLALASPIMWIEGGNGSELYTVNIGTGAITDVGYNGGQGQLIDIAFAPDGTLYGNTRNALYTINTTTGAATLVAVTSTEITDIAFDPSGALYSFIPDGNSGNGQDLVTINPATGTISPVGPINNGNGLGDLSFLGGALYTFDTSDELYRIDLETGAGTPVGNTQPENIEAFQGLASPDNTTLYGVTYRLGADGIDLYTIDPSTAALSLQLTFAANLGEPALGGIDGIAFGPQAASATPEPSTSILAVVGLLRVAFRLRRKS